MVKLEYHEKIAMSILSGTATLTGEHSFKQPSEADRVVVWAQSGPAKDVCEGALAAWVGPKEQEPLCR